jgi:hypothetical protein
MISEKYDLQNVLKKAETSPKKVDIVWWILKANPLMMVSEPILTKHSLSKISASLI